MKPRTGMRFTRADRLIGSTTRSATAITASTPTGPKAISRACVGWWLVNTTTFRRSTCTSSPISRRGWKTTAGWTTARWPMGWSSVRWLRGSAGLGRAIGSGWGDGATLYIAADSTIEQKYDTKKLEREDYESHRSYLQPRPSAGRSNVTTPNSSHGVEAASSPAGSPSLKGLPQ